MNTGRFQVFYFFPFPAYLTFWIFCFSEYQACIFFFFSPYFGFFSVGPIHYLRFSYAR